MKFRITISTVVFLMWNSGVAATSGRGVAAAIQEFQASGTLPKAVVEEAVVTLLPQKDLGLRAKCGPGPKYDPSCAREFFPGAIEVERVLREYPGDPRLLARIAQYGVDRIYIVYQQTGTVQTSLPTAEKVSPNRLFRLKPMTSGVVGSSRTETTENLPQNLLDLGVGPLWRKVYAGGVPTTPTARLVFIGTGIAIVPDLRINRSLSRDFSGGNNPFADEGSHETAVAGVAMANHNLTAGISGVCLDCEGISYKIFKWVWIPEEKKWTAIAEYSALLRAYAELFSLPDVIFVNCSYSGDYGQVDANPLPEEQAFMNALQDKTLFLVAAGNDAVEASGTYPCNHNTPTELCIGSVGSDRFFRRLSRFSQYGKPVQIAALGEAVQTTWADGSYNEASGTSIATPHITGLAGLLYGVAKRILGVTPTTRQLQMALAEGGFNPSLFGQIAKPVDVDAMSAWGALKRIVKGEPAMEVLVVRGVISAWSNSSTLAVGDVVSIYGENLANGYYSADSAPLPEQLGGIRVLVNRYSYPGLYLVSPSQVNFTLPSNPFSLRAGQVNTIGIARYDEDGGLLGWGIVGKFTPAQVNPAFLQSAWRPDGSLVRNDNPAKPGEAVTLFATGLGRTDPFVNFDDGVPTGTENLANPLTVDFVTASGLVKTQSEAHPSTRWPGVYEVRVQVPPDLQPVNNLARLKVSVAGQEVSLNFNLQ